MFISAVNAILTALRELQDVRTPIRLSKYWIMYSNSEQTTIYPFVSLKHVSTTSSSSGHGQNEGVTYKEKVDSFVAVAGQKYFYLTKQPLLAVSAVELNPDPDPPQTYPDYFIYNTDYSVAIVRAGVPAGTIVDVTYNYNIESYAAKSRQVTHTYNVKVEVLRNTTNVNDNLFTISGENYANGKLLDYMTNLVWDKLMEKYDAMRALGWSVYPVSVSEEVYDPDTRLFTKVITLTASGTSVTPPPTDEQYYIWDVQQEIAQDAVLAPQTIDDCETDEGWGYSGLAIAPTVNPSVRVEGKGALNLGKSSGGFLYASYQKTISAIDLTDKAVFLSLFIKDIALLKTTDAVEIRLQNNVTDFYYIKKNKADLINTWNTLGAPIAQWQTNGSPVPTGIVTLRIIIQTENFGDTIPLGSVVMDWWRSTNLF